MTRKLWLRFSYILIALPHCILLSPTVGLLVCSRTAVSVSTLHQLIHAWLNGIDWYLQNAGVIYLSAPNVMRTNKVSREVCLFSCEWRYGLAWNLKKLAANNMKYLWQIPCIYHCEDSPYGRLSIFWVRERSRVESADLTRFLFYFTLGCMKCSFFVINYCWHCRQACPTNLVRLFPLKTTYHQGLFSKTKYWSTWHEKFINIPFITSLKNQTW